jgi:hypothetical protein
LFRTFWHQLLRFNISEVSTFICAKILRLEKPSIIERYTHIVFVFTASGFYHIIYSRAAGRTDHDFGTMAFFQAFPAVIMLEDGIQAIGRQISGVTRNTEVVPLWKKIIGYVWVIICLSAFSPWMLFSTSKIDHRDQWMLPYSAIEYFGIQSVGIALGISTLVNILVFKPEV